VPNRFSDVLPYDFLTFEESKLDPSVFDSTRTFKDKLIFGNKPSELSEIKKVSAHDILTLFQIL